ncbi:MAG: kelch repeat-containing protein [Planctomycetota bacterium]
MQAYQIVVILYGILVAQETSQSSVNQVEFDSRYARFMAGSTLDTKRQHIILYGGRDLSKAKTCDDLIIFSISNNTWSRIETDGDTPGALFGPAITYDEGTDSIFLFGGWPAEQTKPTADLWKLTLNSPKPKWTNLSPEGKRPKGRNGHVFVADSSKNRLLLHSGDRGTHPKYGFLPGKDLWEYDDRDNEWRKLEPTGDVPGPRWNHSGALDARGRRLFVYGGAGYEDDRAVIDQDIFCLDLDNLRWKRLSTKGKKPPPLQGATLTLNNDRNKLMLVGGLSLAPNGVPGLQAIMCYDIEAEAWEQIGKLETTRHGHAATADSQFNHIHILGGETTKERGNFLIRGTPLANRVVIDFP